MPDTFPQRFSLLNVKDVWPLCSPSIPAGYINVLRLSSKDLHMKNTNTQNDSQAMVIDPAKLTK